MQEEAWFTGEQRLGAVGAPAMAGWHEHPPFHPRRFADTDPAAWDATERAKLMDTYGVKAQILYPNVAVFDAKSIVKMGDTALQLACIEAYNDFLVDFGNEQPGRFVAVSGLPFWDLPATLSEIERCAANGHKGIVFTQDPSYFGLPQLTDRYWDPMWASAQEKGLPVNFHIASGDLNLFDVGHPDNGIHANYAAMGVSFFLANARTIAQLVTGGICHRFPDLNFVSVESGIGWIPFALESLDWQWRNCGVAKSTPSTTCCPASTSSGRSTAASGSREIRPSPRSIRSVPTTCCTRPISRTPRACPRDRRVMRSGQMSTSARCSAPSTSTQCARSCTTTQRGSTTSTEKPTSRRRPLTRRDVGCYAGRQLGTTVGRPSTEPTTSKTTSIGMPACNSWAPGSWPTKWVPGASSRSTSTRVYGVG